MAAFSNATDFVIAIENMLGWAAVETPERPLWKIRAIEAGKINKRIRKDPALYTWDNLELALSFAQAKRLVVNSPVFLTYLVEEALEEAKKNRRKPEPARPLGELIDADIAHEMSTQHDGWEDWVGTLTRAVGPGRIEVHRSWLEAGRDK